MPLAYTITYSHRKTLAIWVKRDASVFVRSPMGYPLRKIEHFIELKKDWILRTVEKMKNIRQNESSMKTVLWKWDKKEALSTIVERVEKYAKIMDLSYNQVKLSNARCNWGSCTPRNDILINWRLVHFPLSVLDYVVIHELAHLRERNHGARFWSLVKTHCPEYKELRKILRNWGMGVISRK